MDRDLDGRPRPAGEPLTVDWQRGMSFDGLTARFEAAVNVSTKNRRMKTDTLEVAFNRPIRFADPGDGRPPKPEELRCMGGVWAENETGDSTGRLSLDHMQVAELSINLLTGVSTATGPGWLSSVRRGGATVPGVSLPPALAQARPNPAQGDPGQLRLLEVRFQQGVTGNWREERMTIQGQVKSLYVPVESWQARLDPDDPQAVASGGVTLGCDRLSVNRMPSTNGGQPEVELVASGNTRVEGRTFYARGGRITYAEAKGLLILEGTGRTDAELYRQEVIGGPMQRLAAQRISFWPATNALQIVRPSLLDVGQLPGTGK